MAYTKYIKLVEEITNNLWIPNAVLLHKLKWTKINQATWIKSQINFNESCHSGFIFPSKLTSRVSHVFPQTKVPGINNCILQKMHFKGFKLKSKFHRNQDFKGPIINKLDLDKDILTCLVSIKHIVCDKLCL